MEERVILPVQNPGMDGIRVEAVVIDPEQDVAFEALHFGEFTESVARIAGSFAESLKVIRPDKSTLEFSVTAGIEAGKLIAILGKVSGSSTLKISLEWNKPTPDPGP
jgi:hypothetical protein